MGDFLKFGHICVSFMPFFIHSYLCRCVKEHMLALIKTIPKVNNMLVVSDFYVLSGIAEW